MHKKVIRGVTYYYTSVRENGKVKTIYLGRTKSEAKLREAELKDIEIKTMGNKRFWIFTLIVVCAIAGLAFFGGNLVGYLAPGAVEIVGKADAELTLQAGDLLPKDAMVEILLENQKSSITLEEFLEKSGSGLVVEKGIFHSPKTGEVGSGEGYGVRGARRIYPEVEFKFNLIAYTEMGSESGIFDGSCSFENPYSADVSNLIYQPDADYSVDLVPGSVKAGNKSLDDSYVSLELRDGLLSAETDYSEILEGYGSDFAGKNKTFALDLSEIGMEPPKLPGTYTVTARVIYNDTVLEETSSSLTLVSETTEICRDKDGDGSDTCRPDKDCDDTNPNVYPGAEEICGNLIDENCDGYDKPCSLLTNTIKLKKIKYVTKEVEEKILETNEAKVIIKLKDTSRKSEIEKEISPEKKVRNYISVKNFISSVVDDQEITNIIDKFTEDEIEFIRIDHLIELVLDDVVNQTDVWEAWDLGVTGKGQTICVIDSGIDYNHPELSDNYIGGYDVIHDTNDPMDDNGHGTYVSGIVAGIAKDSKIFAVKAFRKPGKAYESDILAGIDYCIRNKDVYNISVILMSFGGWIYNTSCYCDSNIITEEANFAVSQGIFAVAASGNDGRAYLKAPACGTNVTSVGAVDENDSVASLSNIDPLLDLLAPGVGVESTKLGGGYELRSGTSASAAVVAGVASLVLEKENLSPLDLQYRMRSTGFLIEHEGTNYPRVDAYSALVNNVTNIPIEQEGRQCEGKWEEYEPLQSECPEICVDQDSECQDCCDPMNNFQYCGDQSWCDGADGFGFCELVCECVYGYCNAQCADDADCDSDGCYNTPCPGCDWRDYYCNMDPDCDCDYTPYNPDSNSGPCAGGACCTDCMGSGYWQIGGEAAGGTDYCCGDDTNEYRITEHSSTDAPAGYNSGQYACCNPSTDCQNDDTCRARGNDDGSAWCCHTGEESCSATYWYGGDAYSSACTDIVSANRWQIGGEASQGTDYCCGDDGSEFRITETAGSDAPSPYNGGAGETCCNPSTDCAETGTDTCTANTNAAGTIPNRAYCSSGTWLGGDASNASACADIAGANRWQIGGEDCTGGSCLTGCCGDDNGENYNYRIAHSSMDNGWGTDTSDDTCCVSDKCVAAGTCYNDGDVSTDVDSDGDNDYCNAGTWYDCQTTTQCPGGYTCSGGDCITGFQDCTGTEPDPCDCCDVNAMYTLVSAPGGGGDEGPHAMTYWKTDNSCPPYTNESWNYSLGYTFCPTEGQYTSMINVSAAGGTQTCASYANETSGYYDLYTVTWDTDQDWCDCSEGATGCNGQTCWNVGFDSGTTSSCCGDDTGENYRYCNYVAPQAGFPDSGNCVSSDNMCCNPGTDCVNNDGTACTASGSTSDSDGDGDVDYCSSNKWYDCYDDNSHCTIGGTTYTCENYDCILSMIDGGSGTTCDVSNPCLYIQNSTGSAKARFDDNGYVDIKGTYNFNESGTLSCSNCFQIRNSGGTLILYIDSSGNLNSTGFYIKQASPTPSGGDDFQIKDSGGSVVGYIDGATGNLYFIGDLHYNSNF